MDYILREYNRADWLDFLNISDDEWADTIKSIGISMIKDYDGKSIKMIMALYEDDLVGFIYGFILPNSTLIPEFMYVKPEYRKKGIAHLLLHKLEKESGCNTSMIFYHKSLHDFYEKQGYSNGDNLETAMKFL